MGPNGRQASPGIRQTLETATNVAVLVAAVLVTAYFGVLFFRGGSTGQTGNSPQPGLRLAAPDGYDFGQHDHTLILALSTDCAHCLADAPFYRELAYIAGAADCSHGLLALFPDDPDAVGDFQATHELWAPVVANTSLDAIGVSGTPTIMLVDRDGAVERVWVGELSADREQEILELVGPQTVCSGSNV